jgi:hypothetical protein
MHCYNGGYSPRTARDEGRKAAPKVAAGAVSKTASTPKECMDYVMIR